MSENQMILHKWAKVYFYSVCQQLSTGIHLYVISNPAFLVNILAFFISRWSSSGAMESSWSLQNHGHWQIRGGRKCGKQMGPYHVSFPWKKISLKSCPEMSVYILFTKPRHISTPTCKAGWAMYSVISSCYCLRLNQGSDTKEG